MDPNKGNHMKKTLSLLVPCTFFLTSCATIMHGTRQSIGISSNPTNAQIWVDNQYVGQSPLIVEMTRKHNHFIRLELQGYQPYEVTFTRQMSAWVFGNVVFGGIIGLAVDAITGGIYRLTPEQIQAQMLSDHVRYYKKSADSFVAIVMEADPSWEKVGQLTSN